MPCPEICKPGCACPRGQVIKDGKKCVNINKCPQGDIIIRNIRFYMSGIEANIGFHCLPITVCPIKGQIYYPECAPCDATCENPDVAGCLPICKPGCACPRGEVIKKGKKCVKPEKC